MNADRFYDGVYDAANRTNEASGRSWHVPERHPRTAFYVWTGLILVACALPVICAWVLFS